MSSRFYPLSVRTSCGLDVTALLSFDGVRRVPGKQLVEQTSSMDAKTLLRFRRNAPLGLDFKALHYLTFHAMSATSCCDSSPDKSLRTTAPD